MADVQIPDLTSGLTLDGTELFESVQNGASVKLTSAQIAAYAQSTPGADLTFTSPLVRNVNNVALTTVSPTLGGTGITSGTNFGVIYWGDTFGVTAAATDGQVLTGVSGGAPVWADVPVGAVSSVSFGTTGLTPSSPGVGDIVVAGTLVAANGGTGQSSYATGDLLYASGATALSKLAAAASNNVLLSGTAPSWGKVNLTSMVTGALPVANAGTGFSSYAVGDVLYADTTTSLAKLADVATGNALISGGVTTAPSWGKIGLTTHVSGTLGVTNGGTGVATITGIIKGAGTSAFAAATAGSDYVAPGTATTFTAFQTFSGTSSNAAVLLSNALEKVTISATAATGTIAYDVTTQSVLWYTTNSSANWTVNFRGSSGTALNTILSTGQSVTVAFMVQNGATPHYNNTIQVDGNSVTVVYQGGSAWSAGNASSIDVYCYTIVKTGSAAFTVFASQTQFA
jgi:hypothetical protein